MSTATSAGPRAPVRRAKGLAKGNEQRAFTPVPKPVRNVKSCCDKPEFDFSDNQKVCINCGTQISESNIVAEVTFGETSTGAATVQGGYVGENARYAKNVGAAASRRIGTQYQSREETEQNGRRELRALCPQLHVAQNVEDVAVNLWKLAAMHNFIQGRRTAEVAGVCLYAACRRDRHNTVLLMDISDALHVNVFRLGDIYKELNKTLYLEVHSHIQPIVEVEPLLYKYANELEFGEKTRQVAEDAARIVKRMKRDWMVTGRHPAGLCGACIILAARMNNFRRTVREVVYVVKVADMTITSRLAEFKQTRSSTMTVTDFRSKAMHLKVQHDPPSVQAAALRQQKLARTLTKRNERKLNRLSVDLTDGDSEASQSRASSVAVSPSPEPHKNERPSKRQRTDRGTASPSPAQNRVDADGFAIPAPPSEKAKPGEPKKAAKAVVPLTDQDFVQENELQDEIEELLQDPECVSSRNETEREKLEARAREVATQQRAATLLMEQSQGRTRPSVSDAVEIGEDEFADDPEVQHALLSDDQVKVKEKIWVAHNEDWLRAQQAKQLKRAMDEAEGRTGEKRNHGGGGRRKRSRLGDGTVLTDGGTPVASPMDAATRMIEKRAPNKIFSRNIDYAALNRVMGTKEPDAAATPDAESRDVSVAASPAAAIELQHDVVEGIANAKDKADRLADEAMQGNNEGDTPRDIKSSGDSDKGQEPEQDQAGNDDDDVNDDDDDDEPDEDEGFDEAAEDLEGDFGLGSDDGYDYDDDGGGEFE